jgi:hypothetical protein
MGFVVSLLIIAVGAILTWGVNDTSSSVNLSVIGVVLMCVGLVGFILTLFFWESFWGPGYFRRTRYSAGAGTGYDYGPAPWRRRGYVVEEDAPAGPPAAPPPGPPPP